MLKKIVVLVIAFWVNTHDAAAQLNDFSKADVSIGISSFVYMGDLTPQQFGDFNLAKPGVQVAAKVPLTRNLAFKGSCMAGSLRADDGLHGGWREKRSFSFTSNVVQVAGFLQWEFVGNNWEHAEQDRYTRNYKVKRYKPIAPYAFIGIGYLRNDVKRDMTGIDSVYFAGDIAWVNYYKEAGTVYKSGLLVMPVGIGTHIFVSPYLRFYVEFNYHQLFDDGLDNFGVAVMSKVPDAFHTVTVGFNFRFAKYNERNRREVCNLNL